jgi:L-cysteine S-thiosulfotransferase
MKSFTTAIIAAALFSSAAAAQTMTPSEMATMAPATSAPAAAGAAAGEAVAFDRVKGNCLACHVIAGGSLAGSVGPALQNMKVLVPDRNQLYAIIYDEQARNPQTVMPLFGKNKILTPAEINDIVDFLYTK